MKHFETARQSIEKLTNATDRYSLAEAGPSFQIKGDTSSNGVFIKGPACAETIRVDFRNAANCKLMIGANVTGRITVHFVGRNSLVYIGDDCRLNHVQIRSRQNDDLIAIGEGVTTTGRNTWISGNGSGDATPAIVIGDDCMFSSDIVIRNTDAHPVFDLETHQQLNEPEGIVHIEPHVWIGEHVSILKTVTIGACSVIGMGSIVTRDVPRFSTASGVPARSAPGTGSYWSRNYSQAARDKAIFYSEKYGSVKS